MKTKERIVIVGGGFAGLNLIKGLDKRRFEVILVDRNNFHSFPPAVLSDSVERTRSGEHLVSVQAGDAQG